ncbi:hypothetical protein PGB90_000470 [Kerria lacca]
MVQFLYRKKQSNSDRLLVFLHLQTISLYELTLDKVEFRIKLLEIVTNSFSWAQWDAHHQCLFYIHHRKSSGHEENTTSQISNIPTLSAFQFHDDMPHETVLNVPLNLPEAKVSNTSDVLLNVYDDIPIPLRIRDCSLNILILMQSSGIVYICHYYFYQAISESSNLKIVSTNSNHSVNFAYSVTILHHGSMVHCSVPDITWNKAMDLKPLFVMLKDQHLLVYVSDLFAHVLDLGISHEPCCHFAISTPLIDNSFSNLVPIPGTTSEVLDLSNLDILETFISKNQLIQSFNDENTSLHNKLSILHYILMHLNDMEMIKEIVLTFAENITDVNNVQLIQEILVGSCYVSVSRHISSDAMDMLRLLPLTTTHSGSIINEKVNNYSVTLEQEMLCNPSVMLLTPRQRLIPFRSDVWIRLWGLLPNHILTNSQTSRFKHCTVVNKLTVSLVCYQPEALSRCCTPLSPGIPHIASTGTLAEVTNISRSNKLNIDPLPFNEIEASAASKQEHVISVNLREISLHLVKLGKSPMQVHVIAVRYVSSQAEISRILCSYLTQAAGIDTKRTERGFSLIDRLPKDQRYILFALLERYYVAVDNLAFPLPQGFTSFFAYLGYRVFPTSRFIDYVRVNVFQVNIDVMKAIMADLSDKGEDLRNKLNLLTLLPRSRIKRILNQWSHPVSLMIRSREHALNILSGISSMHSRTTVLPKGIRHGAGLTAFPSSERLSPLDTFLDLLTAKANLTEIDFSLLIEATITSTENFLNE